MVLFLIVHAGLCFAVADTIANSTGMPHRRAFTLCAATVAAALVLNIVGSFLFSSSSSSSSSYATRGLLHNGTHVISAGQGQTEAPIAYYGEEGIGGMPDLHRVACWAGAIYYFILAVLYGEHAQQTDFVWMPTKFFAFPFAVLELLCQLW